jgi:hypothetical protein
LGQVGDARFHRRGEAMVLPPRAGRVGQGEHPAVAEAPLPARDEAVGDAEGRTDRGVAGPVGKHHDAARAPRDAMGRGGRAQQLVEVRALDHREREAHNGSKHAPRCSKTDAINISDVIH